MTQEREYTIAICWNSIYRQWRWKCQYEGCDGSWRGTTCAEIDNPGCVKTAALNHADTAHAGDSPIFDDLGECPDEATRI